MATTTTLLTLRTDVLDIIRADEGDAVYPNSLINRAINKAQRDICNGTIRHPQTGEWINKLTIPYLEREAYYTTAIPTTVSVTATAGATSLTVSTTTDFATSGYIVVDSNIISYSGVTATSFTGIPATGTGSIAYGHINGTVVYPLYVQPTDCNLITQLVYDRVIELPYIDYRDVTRTMTWTPIAPATVVSGAVIYYPSVVWYTILHGTYLLVLHRGVTPDRPLKLLYQAKPTDLSSNSDITIIPDDFARSVLPYIACAEIMKNRGESDQALYYEIQGFDEAKKHTLVTSRQTAEQFFKRPIGHGYQSWSTNL